MEVQPVVVYQSTNERVERESQPADEMCEKHHPLMGLWGRDDVYLGRESVNDPLGQVSGLTKLLDVFLLNRRSHPLATCSGSGHGWSVLSSEGS